MKSIRVIVKVTNACNLRCKYCYNSETEYNKEILPLERFEKLIRMLAKDYTHITVTWHGGEPLYCGLEYYQKAMAIMNELTLMLGVKIRNSVQTNGTLIDNKWIEFFKKNDWNVGISFDGLEHNKYRAAADKTLAALKMLKNAGIKFGTLAVVPEGYDVAANYEYFKSLGYDVEFSPLFLEGGGKDMRQEESFAKQMNDLFDKWLFDTEGVGVRTFYNYISMAVGGPYRVCSYNSCVTKFLCLAADGTIYNCSRHSVMAYPFANVDEINSSAEIFATEGFAEFLKGNVERRRKCLETCDLYDYCCGGCPDCAILENGLSNPPLKTCATFKAIFTHVKAKIEKVIADGTPLSKLNPQVKRVLASACAVGETSPENNELDRYGE